MKKEFKSCTLQLKSIDEKKGQVSFYFATWDRDRDGDTISKDAFDRTLKDNKDAIYHNEDHEAVVGTPSSFGTDDKGAYCTSQLMLDTTCGKDCYEHYKAGAIRGHSMEYVATKHRPDGKGGRIITDLDLWGVTSMTKIPANPKATTISVKGMSEDELENLTHEEKEALINKLTKKSNNMDKKNFLKMDDVLEFKKTFNQEERDKYAKSGVAMPDGSFPIRNAKDLENAIHDVGRANNPSAAKAHIKKRAQALGLSSSLPDDWKSSKVEVENKGKKEDGKVIGTTYDGKAIHNEPGHKGHDEFDSSDHAQAFNKHIELAKAETKSAMEAETEKEEENHMDAAEEHVDKAAEHMKMCLKSMHEESK